MSNSNINWISTLYDSFFLQEECLINLLGKYKYSINQDVYKYYFDNYGNDKDKLLNKNDFINKYSVVNNDRMNDALKHYKKLFTNNNI